jgi:UDP:flavonoid glycosyltransferase YjiC (YdhE family)
LPGTNGCGHNKTRWSDNASVCTVFEDQMRALFTVADGGRSHLYPLVPLARDLEKRGHTVAIAAPPRLGEVAAGLGLQVMPLPARQTRQTDPAGDDPDPAATPSLRLARAAVSRYLSDAARLAGWLASAARGWGADVLVRESAAWAAWLAGELADLPVALFDYAPTPPRLMAMLLGDLFAAARAEAGLPPDPALATIHKWLHLLSGPPGWFPSRSITPVTHILQPPPPLGEAEPIPEWLCELDGAADNSIACVYVTLGSMFHRTPGIFEMIFQAVAGEPLQVVATVGPDTDPGRVDGVPSNVRLVGFMPQAVEAAVLTRADAVVCHGGYGSILASLRHGVPIVSIPLGNADDPARVPGLEALGAGIVVPEHARSAVAVHSALDAVLRDPRYRRSARQAADQMAALPEFSTAAALVERLAAQRRPVLRDVAP